MELINEEEHQITTAIGISTEEMVSSIASAAFDKKALDVEVLDVRGLVDYADYLVICSGTSTTHAGAIADNIDDEMRAKHMKKPMGIEGRRSGLWILLDYADVVVHVFERETRYFYQLEKLWLDAPRVEVNED